MILTFNEYNALKESEESANIYEDLLLRIMEQLEEGSVTHDIFIEKLIEISNEYELDEDFDFSAFLKENEDFFQVYEDDEDEYIIGLSEEGKELFELTPAQGGLHQKARSVRGAYDAIRGKEGPKRRKKWYDVMGGHAATGVGYIAKGVGDWQKQKTKQAKVDAKVSARQDRMARKDMAQQRKYDLKMAKIKAKSGH